MLRQLLLRPARICTDSISVSYTHLASDEQSLIGGTQYLQIQMIGFIFMALTTTFTATLRGVGDSRTAMIYNLIANIVNVLSLIHI